ncbi:hypothetical protein RsTz2092_05210 [Deferribacterales bacterium RsTz2092]|nr:hypothetical protein AGMMS49941_00880 [Deferribacterales bacterium]
MINQRAETLLEVFIIGESDFTEQRIASIRAFVGLLKKELDVVVNNIPNGREDRLYFKKVLEFFRNMIHTYDEEIRGLEARRTRMLDHLLDVRAASMLLHPVEADNSITVN